MEIWRSTVRLLGMVFDSVFNLTDEGWRKLTLRWGVFFLVLAVLNLFPFPPLDGSGAVPLLLTDRATARYQEFIWTNRGLGIIGILIAWQLFSHVFDPVFLFTLNLLYPGAGYH